MTRTRSCPWLPRSRPSAPGRTCARRSAERRCPGRTGLGLAAQGLECLVQPGAEVAPSANRIDDAVDEQLRLHPGLGVDERVPARAGQDDARVAAGIEAPHQDLVTIL